MVFVGQLSQLAVLLCKVALSYWKEKREKGKREMQERVKRKQIEIGWYKKTSNVLP